MSANQCVLNQNHEREAYAEYTANPIASKDVYGYRLTAKQNPVKFTAMQNAVNMNMQMGMLKFCFPGTYQVTLNARQYSFTAPDWYAYKLVNLESGEVVGKSALFYSRQTDDTGPMSVTFNVRITNINDPYYLQCDLLVVTNTNPFLIGWVDKNTADAFKVPAITFTVFYMGNIGIPKQYNYDNNKLLTNSILEDSNFLNYNNYNNYLYIAGCIALVFMFIAVLNYYKNNKKNNETYQTLI